MPKSETELTREELEALSGEPLPEREVMSLLELNPGAPKVPHEVIPIDDPHPDQ